MFFNGRTSEECPLYKFSVCDTAGEKSTPHPTIIDLGKPSHLSPKEQKTSSQKKTCLRESPMIMAFVSVVTLVSHGADELFRQALHNTCQVSHFAYLPKLDKAG